MHRLLRRLQYLRRRRTLEADLAEELRYHQELAQAELEDSGIAPQDAARAARRAMGGITQMREESRGVWIWPWLESVWQDLSYAARSLRRQPGFAAVAILVLACAIGLNTSLFTVFNGVALRPWSVPDPTSVARIFRFVRNPPQGLDNYSGFSVPEYRFLAEHARSLSGLFLSRNERGLRLEQNPASCDFVSGNYFQVLGARMEMGRGFLPEEDRVDAPEPVAILSYSAWQNRFAGVSNLVGRTVRLQDSQFRIIGIAPADFGGTSPEATDLWLPLSSMAILYPGDSWSRQFLRDRNSCCGDVGGRLAPGISREQARAELSLLTAQYARQFQETSDGVVLAGTALLQSPGRKAAEIYAVFGMMFGGVMLVLLLACANVGNLLVARGAARRREIGVRLSLGAGRSRLVRQLLTEILMLATLAGALGVILAWVLPGPIFRSVAGDISMHVQPDLTVLAYTLALTVMACVACGLAPALAATNANLNSALKTRQGSSGRLSLRSTLLAIQVCVSVVLLVSAGLLIRGIQNARNQDPGFSVRDTAALSIELPAAAYQTAATRTFFQTLSQTLHSQPDLLPLGWSDIEPLGNSRGFTGFRLPEEDEKQERMVLQTSVSAGYFDVLRIPILAGRNLEPADSSGSGVLVNQAMADKYFPGQDPVGKTIVTDKPTQIVGLVRNAHTAGLDAIDPNIYVSPNFAAAPRLIFRNTPSNLTRITAAVKQLEPRARIAVTPLSLNFDQWLGTSRIGAAIAGGLGLLALGLAAIGIAGVFAYSVEQRRQEIGIRMALGARSSQVARTVFASAARSLVVGLAFGLLAAVGAAGLLRQYMYGISRLDPITYLAVLLTLAVAGMAATYLPTRRAVRIDPIQALRQD